MHNDTLDNRLELVARNSELDPKIIDHFSTWVRRASDDDLYRIPLRGWATQHEIPEDQALELFLHATQAGIFEMQWGVICPACGISINTPGGLKALGPDPHCQLCRMDFQAAMDDQVEVVFTLEPSVRELRFADPTRIDPVRDTLQMFFSPSLVHTPLHEEVASNVTMGMQIPSHESIPLAFTAEQSHTYAIIIANVHAVGFITVRPGESSEVEFEIHDGAMIPKRVVCGTGPVNLKLFNRTDWKATGVLFDLGPHYDLDVEITPEMGMYKLVPFLTGKQVLTNQTFRDLFRGEVVGEGGLRLKSLAMVFSDLEKSTTLYKRVGDFRALQLVRQHFDAVAEVVNRHRGAIVKTIGDAVMAAFSETERAVAAAAGMARAVQRIDADGEKLRVKVGVHSGPCIAIQTNHQIDYFGQSVNVAARAQGVARGGEIVVTDRVWESPGVQGLIQDFGLASEQDTVSLRGIGDGFHIHRLS